LIHPDRGLLAIELEVIIVMPENLFGQGVAVLFLLAEL
jgi:hypothetical protein